MGLRQVRYGIVKVRSWAGGHRRGGRSRRARSQVGEESFQSAAVLPDSVSKLVAGVMIARVQRDQVIR